MLDGLFGTEMPFAVKFILAFVIVLGAIGVFMWVVRRFGAGSLGGGMRGRRKDGTQSAAGAGSESSDR